MKDLASNQRRHLRALAHHLKPLVSIGKAGSSQAVLLEVQRCLEDHELIKVRVDVDDREARVALAEEVAASSGAVLVQTIGLIAVLYKASSEPTITLPAKKTGVPVPQGKRYGGPKIDWTEAHAAWSTPAPVADDELGDDVADDDGDDEPTAADDEPVEASQLPTAKTGLQGGATV